MKILDILVISDEHILMTKSVVRYEEENLQFHHFDKTEIFSQEFGLYDLIIIDMFFLAHDEEYEISSKIFKDNVDKPVIVLESDKPISLPSVLNIYESIPYPVSTNKLWSALDELIKHNFI